MVSHPSFARQSRWLSTALAPWLAGPEMPPCPQLCDHCLGFSRLPEKALDVVYQAVDEDEGFRQKLLSELDEVEVGELGWVWLNHLDGWRRRIAEAGSESAAVSRVRELELEVEDLSTALAPCPCSPTGCY